MIYQLAVALCLLAAGPASAFFVGQPVARNTYLSSSVQTRELKTIVAPDFYWQYRLDRLAQRKGGDLPFRAANYPDISQLNFKDLYDAYYLDLTLQGKLEGFNWEDEKKITDSEWLTIYKSICKWTAETAKSNKLDTSTLPSNDFDLLRQFYPHLKFRDLEDPFREHEVGNNFKYKNMKDMLQAALDGTLDVPGYDKKITSIEATKAKANLAALKVSTMAKLDVIKKDTLAYAMSPFVDEQAKTHYKKLKAKLADFPQGAAGWAQFRAKMEVEVDEMAKLASKPADPHHGHGHDEEHGHKTLSVAEEFEAKYGRSLEAMNEKMSRYKSDPKGFLEGSIIAEFGQNGLDVWKKSESFSTGSMSESDKKSAEKAFADFLNSA